MMPNKTLIALFLVVGMSADLQAQSRFDREFDDANKPWQEIVTQLPATPKSENLLGFYVSPTTRVTFSIDAKSLSASADGVVRYTLVTKSSSGAESISYEGIRCETFESKLYAVGHKDGTWARSRRDKWMPIIDNTVNRQQAALAKDYFCNDKVVASGMEEMRDRLRWKNPIIIGGNGR